VSFGTPGGALGDDDVPRDTFGDALGDVLDAALKTHAAGEKDAYSPSSITAASELIARPSTPKVGLTAALNPSDAIVNPPQQPFLITDDGAEFTMFLRGLNAPDDTTEAGDSDMESHPSMPDLQAASDDEDDYDSVLMTNMVTSLNGAFIQEVN
jgi:hypothetical protein